MNANPGMGTHLVFEVTPVGFVDFLSTLLLNVDLLKQMANMTLSTVF